MKKLLSFFLLFLTIYSFTPLLEDMEARPGGGGSYRSGGSSSRSSSRSYSSSRSSRSSYGGGSYRGGGGGGELDPAVVKEILGFLFGSILSFIGVILLAQGLTKKEDLTSFKERLGYFSGGLILSMVAAVIAGLSKSFLFLFLLILISTPFILVYMGLKKIQNGRETIFVAKAED